MDPTQAGRGEAAVGWLSAEIINISTSSEGVFFQGRCGWVNPVEALF